MASDNKRATCFYHDWLKTFDKLTDTQVGRLTKAILLYDREEVLPDFSDDAVLDVVFVQLLSTVIRDRNKYFEVRERRIKAANKRWEGTNKKDSEECKCIQTDANECTCTVNVKDNVNVNVKDKDNVNVNVNVNDREREKGQAPSGALSPSPSAVYQYFRENNFQSNPDQFIDYYGARGWMVNGQKIVDWKCQANVWESRERGTAKTKGGIPGDY